MKTESELSELLSRVEKIINRVVALQNPPEDLKTKNCHYRMLLVQQDLYRWLLGDKGYDFEEYYTGLKIYLDKLERED